MIHAMPLLTNTNRKWWHLEELRWICFFRALQVLSRARIVNNSFVMVIFVLLFVVGGHWKLLIAFAILEYRWAPPCCLRAFSEYEPKLMRMGSARARALQSATGAPQWGCQIVGSKTERPTAQSGAILMQGRNSYTRIGDCPRHVH